MFPWRGPARASANAAAAAANATDDAGAADAADAANRPTAGLAATRDANLSTARSAPSNTSTSAGPPRPQLSIDKHFARLGSLGATSAKNAAAAATAAAATARSRAAAAADVGGDTLLKAGRAGVKVGGAVGGAGFGCLARCGTGFSDFFLRSSIVDMAVGVVLGFSFQSLIEALVEAWLTPLLGAIFGATDWSTLSFEINGSKFQYGAFINSLLTFILVVLSCYFFVVAPMERLMAIKNKKRYVTRDCPCCIQEIPIGASKCMYCCSELPELTPEEAEKLAIVNPMALVGTAFESAGNFAGGLVPGALMLGGKSASGKGKGKGGKAGGKGAASAAASASALDASPSRGSAAADQVALDVLATSSEGGGGGRGAAAGGGSSPLTERLARRRRRRLFGQHDVDRRTAQNIVAQELADASALRTASHIVPQGGSSRGGGGGEGGAVSSASGSTHPLAGGASSRRLALGGASGDGTSSSDIEAFARGGLARPSYTTATSGEGSGSGRGGAPRGPGGEIAPEMEPPAPASRRRFF